MWIRKVSIGVTDMKKVGKVILHKIDEVINDPALLEMGEFETFDYLLVFSPDDNGWYWQRRRDRRDRR